eukprot:SAG31_NODE_11780_length_999_cov_1.261111_1_plen_130_part_10
MQLSAAQDNEGWRYRHEYYSYNGGPKGGSLSSGLTVVAYELCDVVAGTGGFGAIPGSRQASLCSICSGSMTQLYLSNENLSPVSGSHKSHFPLIASEQPGPIIRPSQVPSFGKAVAVKAGDAIVFTGIQL